jgi:DUF3079 family protein
MTGVIPRSLRRRYAGRVKYPVRPRHPERLCWGCDTLCPAESLACGNGTIRTLHPVELFGEDWVEWLDAKETARQRTAITSE